jgi:lysophospholipase L1-like esterase
MKKIRILCYGDSNTWGYIPATKHNRYSEEQRWTKRLAKQLGENYEVIEEGLNSRTLISEDTRPGREGRNGYSYLIPCLDTHDPIDLVILMLGTNEGKFSEKADEIGEILEEYYVKTILARKSQFQDKSPQLLIVAPAALDATTSYVKERYNKPEILVELGEVYRQIAERNSCLFLDATSLKVGEDGIHLTEESHKKLADELTIAVNNNFKLDLDIQ